MIIGQLHHLSMQGREGLHRPHHDAADLLAAELGFRIARRLSHRQVRRRCGVCSDGAQHHIGFAPSDAEEPGLRPPPAPCAQQFFTGARHAARRRRSPAKRRRRGAKGLLEILYSVYQNALNDPDWFVILKTIDDSLRDEEGETIDNLRQALEDDKKLVAQGLMTQDEFDQEWYCSFEAAIKGAYYSTEIAEARRQGRIKLVPYDTALRVHTVSDIGIGPAFATGFYQRVGNEMHVITDS